jgi:hypothetical protein
MNPLLFYAARIERFGAAAGREWVGRKEITHSVSIGE